MELQQIRYVIAVAQYRSFTKAADILAVSASTLSEQVRRLEEELGVQLFSRTTRHVELTIPGHTFLNHASQIMTDFSTLREAVRRVEAEPQGIITLGIPLGASAPQFWRVLANFEKQYRGIHIKLTETIIPTLIKSLHSGLLDLSMLSWPSSDVPGDLNLIEVARNPTGLALSRDNPLASRGRVQLRELEHASLITFSEGFALRQIAVDACRRAGFTPAVAFESSSNEAIFELVGCDVGFSILPVDIKMESGWNVTYVECEPASMDRMIGVAWPHDRQLTPTAALLRDRIVEACSGVVVW
jgi:DNA-binding transcriptional LysR family regulator